MPGRASSGVLVGSTDGVFVSMLETAEGRSKLVRSMVQPARLRTDYQGAHSRLATRELFKANSVLVVDQVFGSKAPKEARPSEHFLGALGTYDRLVDDLRQRFDRHILELLREHTAPPREELPVGWAFVLVSAETYHTLVREDRLDDRCWRFRGARLLFADGLEPGVAFGLGAKDEVGQVSYTLQRSDASPGGEGPVAPEDFRVAYRAELRIRMADKPKLAAYVIR